MAKLKSGSTVGGSQIETTSGAQSKADSAESSAKSYTDTHENKSNPHVITPAKIGAETPAGAQTKADSAESSAKSYTDLKLGNYEIQKNGTDGAGIINFKT